RFRLEVRQFTPPTPGQPDKQALHIPLAIGLVGPDGADLRLQPSSETAAFVRRVENEGTQHTAVLDLTEAHQVFEFEQVAQAPVPSLARGLSAPVIIEYA